ncbi:tripartite tricarboxylate transporter substrate binding protein [Variovorax paradoxus]|nr:tripartite tricarboxylate transporter substrate binding protein [Variovorax paradoxus]
MPVKAAPMRRRLVLTALASVLVAPQAIAQNASIVKLVVPYAAGGPADLQARLFAPGLQSALGQTVIVENRPGAGSQIGARYAAAAPKDGKTILIGNASTFAIVPSTAKNPGYDPLRSFTHLGLIAETDTAVVVNPSFAGGRVQDLIAHAKANPGKVSYASAGVGNGAHLIGELLQSTAHVEMTHVPYKSGGEMMTAVIGEQVSFAVVDLTAALPMVREGKLKALAVTSPKRSPELPQVPTMSEAGYPAVSMPYWTGASVPAGTPADVVHKLEAAVRQVTTSPDYLAALKKFGAHVKPTDGKEMAALITVDLKRWGDVARQANIQLD